MEVERLDVTLAVGGLSGFASQMQAADRLTGGLSDKIDRLTAVSELATKTLRDIKMKADQAAATAGVSDAIKRSLAGIATEAERARADIERVKLDSAQAAETTANGDVIDRKLKNITGNANEARRSLESVRLAGMGAGGGGGILGGAAGAAGSGGGGGFGGMGMMPAAIGGAALLAPAAGPGIFGLLSTLPVAIGGMAGTVGTLALAFDGVSKAVGGNLKAFKDLQPAAQQFVLTVRSLDGWFDKLRQTAGAGLFPGLTAGLKAALSPGTVQQITTAVSEFGKAIGEAGAAWGRYFGSSQFQMILGPLMAAGAQNLSKMSDAAMHLFDALGVLGRAAIPLVNWMTSGADAASKWIDNFTRAKDASGGLAHAMGQAQQSLRLVGGLVAELAKVVYDLGVALYPVSKVALKDLVDALGYLDGVIQRNKQTITDIVQGALSALVGIVKTLYPVVSALAGALVAVTKATIGWKGAITLLIGIKVSSILAGWIGSFAAAGGAAAATEGEVTGLRAALLGLGGPEVLAALAAAYGGVKLIQNMLKKTTNAPSSYGPHITKGESIVNVQNDIGYLKGIGDTYSQTYLTLVALEKLMKQNGSVVATAGEITKAQAQAAKQAAANAAITGGAGQHAALRNHGGGAAGPGHMSVSQVYSLLRNAGFSAADASNFVGIAQAESGFSPTALNGGGRSSSSLAFAPGYTAYSRTGDYSAGLFQENFYQGLGPSRTARYAPMFGLNPNMSPTQFVQWLRQHPAAQAQIAYDMFSTSGYSPWRGDAFVSAHPGLLNEGPGGMSGVGNPFGTPPPFTSGLGPKPAKPSVIPSIVTELLNKASRNAANASALSNTGGTAKRFLENELMDLDAAQKRLREAFDKAHGKAKTQLDTALTRVENKITAVTALIAKAIIISGDALLPEKLKTKLAKLTAKGTADADYAAVLTGQTADDYQKTIRKNLLSQAAVIQAEVTSLKTKLVNASGKQKTAIQAELTKVQGALQSVQQSILSNLQQTVQTLQGKVSTLFQSVQASLVTQLGAKYFQNGALTPLEAQLKSMQDADQLGSLKDALQSAKDQQSKDQNTLSSVVYDMTTGRTTYNYSSAAQQQLAADQKAIDAAQRQLDEYNLSIKAAQERQDADQTYAKQLDKLNKQLGPLADAFQNGTGSISALKEIAKSFGLQISDVNTPDLNDLSTASDGLKQAFKDLADYIAKITGATPKIPTTPDSVATLNSQALQDAQASGNVTDIIQAARDAGYTQSIGYLRRAGLIPMADGGSGTVTKPTLFLAGEAGREDFAFSGGGRSFASANGGGGVTVQLHVSALDPSSVDWAPIAEKIRAELLRTQKRNGGTTGIK